MTVNKVSAKYLETAYIGIVDEHIRYIGVYKKGSLNNWYIILDLSHYVEAGSIIASHKIPASLKIHQSEMQPR